jgi:hypothetical protein
MSDNTPTREERIKALTGTVTRVTDALQHVALARQSVVSSSSPRCVLDRAENFTFQRSLGEAETALTVALAIAKQALDELVPLRCGWPGNHLGPWEKVAPYQDVERCTACGEMFGK